jgi:acyl-CoA reductase-like NAD-dependent aldehyde dehydrogenase
VGGRWVDPHEGRRLVTVDPATGRPLAGVPCATPADVDAAVAGARRAGAPGSRLRRMPPGRRARAVHRLGDLVLEHADTFALLDCLDNGKPLRAARHGDVPAAAAVLHYMSGWATRSGATGEPPATATPGRFLATASREPVGVVAAITPWNFPLYMAAAKLAPALAAGCTVVLKPAEQTPLSALLLAHLAGEAGLPPGAVTVLPGGGDVGAALAAHPGVDKVSFTGSTEVGRRIVAAAAGTLPRVALELGGKCAAVVFADADLGAAVPAVAGAAFGNQGEACVAASRLLVERPVFEEVVSGVHALGRRLRLGHGLLATTQLGPLVSAEHRDRVAGHVRDAATTGARVLGGEVPAGPGWFHEPAVVVGARPDAAVVQEEIFGPVVVALPFDDEDEAVRLADDTAYGLAAGVFTGDLARGYRTAARLRAGTVWVNTWNVLDPALPFGGLGLSGWGREMGREGFDAHLETRTVVADLGGRGQSSRTGISR